MSAARDHALVRKTLFDQGRALRQAELDFLRAAGIGVPALVSDPPPWDGEMALIADVIFLPDAPHGPQRFVFRDEVREPAEVSPALILAARDVDGFFADILALRVTPLRVALWRGAVSALGEQFLGDLEFGVVPVATSVGDWLRNGRHGVVILDAAAFARKLLLWPVELLAGDPAQRAALEKALTIRPPRIRVAKDAHGAAEVAA